MKIGKENRSIVERNQLNKNGTWCHCQQLNGGFGLAPQKLYSLIKLKILTNIDNINSFSRKDAKMLIHLNNQAQDTTLPSRGYSMTHERTLIEQ